MRFCDDIGTASRCWTFCTRSPKRPSNEPGCAVHQTQYTQPALFALEYALAELWASWGVVPDIVLGHSVGEYAAACVAGVMSLEDGLALIAERARLMQSVQRHGKMAVVFAPQDRVARADCGHAAATVVVAVINGPENTVISGDAAAVDAAGGEVRGRRRASEDRSMCRTRFIRR